MILINNKLSKIMYKNTILGLYKIMKNLPYLKKIANGIIFNIYFSIVFYNYKLI